MIKSIRIRLTLPVLLMLPLVTVFALQALGQLILAQAADAPDLTSSLLALFGDIKDKAIAAVVIMHVFQILRTHEVFGILGKIGLQGKSLQIAIAIITAAGFVVDAYGKGANLVQALIEGLFTSGGAMLIFDATKSSVAAIAADAVPVVVAKGK